MNHNRPGAGPLTVTVLVHPGVRLLDVTGPIEVFTSANDFGGRYRVRIASEDGAAVTTSAGTRISADVRVDDVREPYDVLVVPGGPEWETSLKDDALLEAVRRPHGLARCTASVCTGAFLLAAAGLLRGRRAVTHWRQSRRLAVRFPSVRVEPDAVFVRDGPMMTSAGVSAGIDLPLALVEEHWGARVARAVAKDMVVFLQRPGGQSQFSVRSQVPPSRQGTLRRVLDAVAENLGAAHTLTAGGGVVVHEAAVEQGQGQEGGDEAEAEHRVAAEEQGEPELAGRGVGDEQGAGRGGDHRRHDRHQPAAERRVRGEAVPGDHQIRHRAGGGEAEDGAERPQHPVHVRRGVEPDHPAAEQQRSGADREQCHRRCAEELGHDRIGRVRPRRPVPESADGRHDQQRHGARPDDGGGGRQPGKAPGQGRRRVGEDAGAHHGREPTGAERWTCCRRHSPASASTGRGGCGGVTVAFGKSRPMRTGA